MNNSLRDYQLPIIIDIGTERVKFSQPDLNLLQVHKNIKNINFIEEEKSEDLTEDEKRSKIN